MAAPRRRGTVPVTTHTSKTGVTTYSIRVATGRNVDGTVRRESYTFPTRAEAKAAYKTLTADIARGTHVQRRTVTLAQYVETWLAGKRDVRPGTLAGYRQHLRPVVEALGDRSLQSLTKADFDQLVADRLGLGGRRGRTDLTEEQQALLDWVTEREEVRYREVEDQFGKPGGRRLARLYEAGLIEKVARGTYAASGAPTTRPGRGGVSAVTVTHMLVIATSVLDAAVAEGLLVRNVAKLVKRPRAAKHDLRVWSAAQREAFADHIDGDRLAGCWHLSLAGLRRSEVLGVVWSTVDLDAGLVHVRQARTALGPREDRIDVPKSARSRRAVPLDPRAVVALRKMKATQAAERLAAGAAWTDEAGLVAVHEDGQRLRPEWYTDQFQKRVAEAGLPMIRLHDLRGSLSSILAEQGVPVEVRSALLGHDAGVNRDRYTTISADAMAAAMRAVSGG